MSDAINPDHYKRLPAEAIEIIEAMIAGAPDNKSAHLHGQAAKYDLRLWGKGKSLEDYLIDWRKHIWYALRLESHLLELIEKQKTDEQQKAADLQSLKDHPFGKLKTGSLNSDTIPEGHRKLGDSLMEQRQLGDLRWSIIEQGYIPISGDEIVCANRDNWAACRKITGEVTGEVKPPDGWRWLEVGEAFRKGDTTNTIEPISEHWVGTQCVVKHVALRRNKFEVGEKVVYTIDNTIWTFTSEIDDGPRFPKSAWVTRVTGIGKISQRICVNHLAPYIEDAKPTTEVTGEVTGEVKPPDGWRWLEVGEVIRKGDLGFENGLRYSIEPIMIGMTLQPHWRPTIRRNKFEVGEKVVYIGDKNNFVFVVKGARADGHFFVERNWHEYVIAPKFLAPYIEETT